MAAVIGGHFFCLPMADGECWRSISLMPDSPSSIFRCKICALLPGEIDTLHGQALYEAIKGTVRPASVFLKEDCGLEFVVAEISYGEFIRKFIKKLFFFTRFNLLIIRVIGRFHLFVFIWQINSPYLP